MKKYILIAIVVLLGSGAFFYFYDFGTDKNFAISNIEAITKVELNNKTNQVILTKTDNGQWLAASFDANMRKVSNLKKILADIEVEYPLPAMYEHVYTKDKIINDGILIKAFDGKNLVKSYYILFTDSIGTIGMVNDKYKPYILGFASQNIDLEDYIVPQIAFWENNVIFSFLPGEIKNLKVEHTNTPQESYAIEQNNGVTKLFDLNKNEIEIEIEIEFDKHKMEQYLSYFNNISFDHNLDISDHEKQQLLSVQPLYTLTINSEIICYVSPIDDPGTDNYGNRLIYNRDVFNIIIPKKNIFAKAKWLNFDILIEELNYFKN